MWKINTSSVPSLPPDSLFPVVCCQNASKWFLFLSGQKADLGGEENTQSTVQREFRILLDGKGMSKIDWNHSFHRHQWRFSLAARFPRRSISRDEETVRNPFRWSCKPVETVRVGPDPYERSDRSLVASTSTRPNRSRLCSKPFHVHLALLFLFARLTRSCSTVMNPKREQISVKNENEEWWLTWGEQCGICHLVRAIEIDEGQRSAELITFEHYQIEAATTSLRVHKILLVVKFNDP